MQRTDQGKMETTILHQPRRAARNGQPQGKQERKPDPMGPDRLGGKFFGGKFLKSLGLGVNLENLPPISG